MWYDYKPSEYNKIDETAIYAEIRDSYNRQHDALVEAEQMREQTAYNERIRQDEEYVRESYQMEMDQQMLDEAYAKQNNLTREAMVAECMMKLYEKSYVGPMSAKDRTVGRNLINNFVKENGAVNLIYDWHHKNMILSEFSRICTKHYNKLLEAEEEMQDGSPVVKDFKIDPSVSTEFFEDLEDIDYSDASRMINDRVSDAITDFTDENISTKMDIQDIIDTAKDQVDMAQNESYIESIKDRAHQDIQDIQNSRTKNVFQMMVEGLTRKTFTDSQLKERCFNENSVDMDSVVDSVQSIYHFLEMCNTTKMINMNEQFIENYLGSL